MFSLLTILALDLVSPTCVSSFEQTACGFHCVSSLNGLACAQTPDGLCAKTPSRVACWDPPPDVRKLLAADPSLQRPTCITRGSSIACGFHCATTLERAACSNTPMGNCRASFGQLLCWDPAPEVRWTMEDAGRLETARCESTLSEVACGYNCVTAGQKIACSATPGGFCARRFDVLACFDPAPVLQIPSQTDPR